MKIGFDARLIASLGIGRYISGLLPALADLLGDRLVVLTGSAHLARVRAMTEGRSRLMVSDAPPYRLAEQSTLLLTLLRSGVRLVHFPHYNLPLAFSGRFVVTIHDLFSFDFPDIHSGWLPRRVNQLLIGNAVRRASAIITPSQSTASAVGQNFPRASSIVTRIAEGVDERFNPGRNRQAEVSWQRYLGARPPYFLYLGQWKPYKNVDLLVEAFRQVNQQRPDVQLVIGGGDPRYSGIRAAVASLPEGSVVLPGHLPDDAVPDLYRGAAALLLPSRAEGFGLPVLEAMACGVTVICSDIPVLREIADDVAIFCDPSSPQAFADGMLSTLSQPDGSRTARGTERARQFSWLTAAEETVGVYERTLAGRPRRRAATD